MHPAYRALRLSDVHQGTGAYRAVDLLKFLDEVSANHIYLTGDIVDLQRLRARPRLPTRHWKVATRFVELARTGTRIVYIPGNHDSLPSPHSHRSLSRPDMPPVEAVPCRPVFAQLG